MQHIPALRLALMLYCLPPITRADDAISSSQAFGESTTDFLSAMNTHNDWRTWITTPVWTYHYNREMANNGELSENNPGIGLERCNGNGVETAICHWAQQRVCSRDIKQKKIIIPSSPLLAYLFH